MCNSVQIRAFGNDTIADISCPVITITGEEDSLLSGQDSTWYDQLTPEVQQKSTQINLGAATGAALQGQAGSQIAGSAPLFAALNPIMKVAPNAAPAPRPQGNSTEVFTAG